MHRDATAEPTEPSTTAAGAPERGEGGDGVRIVTTDEAQGSATRDEASAAAAAAATEAPMPLSAASKWATPTAAQLQGTVARAPMPPPKPPPPNVVQSQLQWCQVQCAPEQGCALGRIVGVLAGGSRGVPSGGSWVCAPERHSVIAVSTVCALLRGQCGSVGVTRHAVSFFLAELECAEFPSSRNVAMLSARHR